MVVVRARVVLVLVAMLACSRTKPSTPPASASKDAAPVQQPAQLTGRFAEVFAPYSLSFAIPDGIELARSKPEVGGGYEWVSSGEPGAIIVRWHSARATDELLSGGDPASAMASVLIGSFGGTDENLVDRTALKTPAKLVGTSWRVAAPTLTGWIAIYTNAPHPDADGEEVVDIFVIVVLGAPGSRTAFDGDAASAIRDSIRFAPR